jgi:hypothetical protein
MLEAMARIAPSQPNETMARISPRSLMVGLGLGFSLSQVKPPDDHCSNLEARNFSEFNGANGEEQNFTRPSKILWTRFEIVLEGSNRFEKRIGNKKGSMPPVTFITETHNFTLSVGAIYAESPCSVATFVVNSEAHAGARPSVRLCVGLIIWRG